MKARTAVLSALAAAAGVFGYSPFERSPGTGLFRDDVDRIVYFVDPSTAAGLHNSDGDEIISPGSAPEAAIVSAMERWSGVPHSAVRFEPPRFGDFPLAFDGTNLITFADTPANRAVTFGAIAVTRLFSDSNGRLTDTDVAFSPEFSYSTVGDPDAFDLEAVLVHELGHALGLDHSSVMTASLFATTVRAAANKRSLTEDERAFARDFYPDPSAAAVLGEIRGRVLDNSGEGVRGASVAAVNTAANFVAAVLSERDGSFRIAGLPPGEYSLYAEPLDGPAEPFQLSSPRGDADLGFMTAFADAPVGVNAGQSAIVDIAVPGGAPTLNPRGFGAHLPGEELRTRFGAFIERGSVYEVEAFGERLDELSEGDIEILGTGLSLRAGSLRSLGTIRFGDGPSRPLIGFEMQASANAPVGSASVVFHLGGETAVATGAVRIFERTGTADLQAVVSAAGFDGGPVAPGSIVSLFGENLGPDEPVLGGFDPLTGRLTPQLSGVSVLFSGRAGALFFGDGRQLNVQAPADLPIGPTAVEVVAGERRSAPAQSMVAPTAPALFLANGAGQVAALNIDGSVNSAAFPANSGEPLTLFANGQGALDPPLATGQAGGVSPLSRTVADTRVFVGGVEAAVDYSGAAPGLVGVLQINIRTAPGTPTGSAVPIRIVVGSVESPPGATAAIR